MTLFIYKLFLHKITDLISICNLDSDYSNNLRIEALPTSITANEFTIRVRKWASTKIYGVGVAWIAFGN